MRVCLINFQKDLNYFVATDFRTLGTIRNSVQSAATCVTTPTTTVTPSTIALTTAFIASTNPLTSSSAGSTVSTSSSAESTVSYPAALSTSSESGDSTASTPVEGNKWLFCKISLLLCLHYDAIIWTSFLAIWVVCCHFVLFYPMIDMTPLLPAPRLLFLNKFIFLTRAYDLLHAYMQFDEGLWPFACIHVSPSLWNRL